MPAVPIRWVLIKDPKGSLKPGSYARTPRQFKSCNSRWQVEVTLRKPVHLGLNQASMVTAATCVHHPALLALFSIVTVVAHQQQKQHPFELPKAAWYRKTLPTPMPLALVDNSQMQTFRCRVPM